MDNVFSFDTCLLRDNRMSRFSSLTALGILIVAFSSAPALALPLLPRNGLWKVVIKNPMTSQNEIQFCIKDSDWVSKESFSNPWIGSGVLLENPQKQSILLRGTFQKYPGFYEPLNVIAVLPKTKSTSFSAPLIYWRQSGFLQKKISPWDVFSESTWTYIDQLCKM